MLRFTTNKLPFYSALLIGLTLLSISFQVEASAEVSVVTAKGVGSIISNDTARARDEALRDAFRRAIEQAVGIFIDSESIMENLHVIKDRIYAHSRGYIRSYSIINEWAEADNLYHVIIEATVDFDNLKMDIKALGITIKEVIGNPRILILIEEVNLGIPSMFSVVEAELRRIFAEKGFFLVDQAQINQIKDTELTKRALRGDTEAIIALALNFDADISVVGKAFSELLLSKQVRSITMHSVRAYTDIKTIITQTAQIVATMNPEETQYASSQRVAGNNALKTAATKLADGLAMDVINALSAGTRGFRVRSIQLIVTGLNSFTQLTRLKGDLQNLRGVERVYQRMFEGSIAKLDIDTTSSAKDLAVRLESLPGVKSRVTAMSMNKIEIEVIQ